MFSTESEHRIMFLVAIVVAAGCLVLGLYLSIRWLGRNIKSKSGWLLFAIVRIPLVAILWLLSVDLLCFVLAHLGDSSSIDFIRTILVFGGMVLTLGWLGGYAIVIRLRSPFFTSRSPRFQCLASVVLAVPLLLLSWLCLIQLIDNAGGYISNFIQRNGSTRDAFPFDIESRLISLVTGGDPASVPYLAEFISPTDPSRGIIIVEDSFFDSSEAVVFTKTKGQRMVYLANSFFVPYSNEDSEYCYSHAQWTKDGLVFVCALIAAHEPTVLVGYDFSTSQAIKPRHFDGTGTIIPELALKWSAFNSTVEKLAVAHGGLIGDPIDLDAIRRRQYFLIYWQMPAIPIGE